LEREERTLGERDDERRERIGATKEGEAGAKKCIRNCRAPPAVLVTSMLPEMAA